MRPLIIFALMMLAAMAQAQMLDSSALATTRYGNMTVRKPINPTEIYKVVEQMPVFPGGQSALMAYLAKTPYPPVARDSGIMGRVTISMVIDVTGNVTQFQVTISSGSKLLDDAALARIAQMPQWQPGRQRGQPVAVQLVVPVYFHIN